MTKLSFLFYIFLLIWLNFDCEMLICKDYPETVADKIYSPGQIIQYVAL